MSTLGNFEGVSPVGFSADAISFVTQDSAAAVHKLGTRRIFGGEEYVWIHNAMSGTELSPGELVTTSGLSGYSLTNSTTAADDLPMAVIKHVSIPTGGYGWGLVRGICEVLKIASTLSTGAIVTVGDNGQAKTALGGSFPTGPVIGKVLSSGTSACKAYVRLFG